MVSTARTSLILQHSAHLLAPLDLLDLLDPLDPLDPLNPREEPLAAPSGIYTPFHSVLLWNWGGGKVNSVRKLYQLAEKKFALLRDHKKAPWMFLVCLKQDLDLFKMAQYNI